MAEIMSVDNDNILLFLQLVLCKALRGNDTINLIKPVIRSQAMDFTKQLSFFREYLKIMIE